MSNNNALPPSLVETIAGLTAGVVTTLVVHPLDIIKTRLQGKQPLPPPPAPPSYSNWRVRSLTPRKICFAVDRQTPSWLGGSLRIVRDIAQNEGSNIKAFYRGLTPNLVGNSVSWGLYFLWYATPHPTMQFSHGHWLTISSQVREDQGEARGALWSTRRVELPRLPISLRNGGYEPHPIAPLHARCVYSHRLGQARSPPSARIRYGSSKHECSLPGGQRLALTRA